MPEVGLDLDRQQLVAGVGACDLLQQPAQPDQHPLVLAHVSGKRFSGLRYRAVQGASSVRVSTKARTARSSSSWECAAETWARIRALPWGTTG